MSASIGQSIDAVCKEKGIDRDVVIEAVKEAVRAAARKQFKSGEEVQVEWAPESGLEIFASKVVVEEVTNPGRELSLDEARELAGDEVEVATGRHLADLAGTTQASLRDGSAGDLRQHGRHQVCGARAG